MTKTQDVFQRPNPGILKKEEKVEAKSKGVVSEVINEIAVRISPIL